MEKRPFVTANGTVVGKKTGEPKFARFPVAATTFALAFRLSRSLDYGVGAMVSRYL